MAALQGFQRDVAASGQRIRQLADSRLMLRSRRPSNKCHTASRSRRAATGSGCTTVTAAPTIVTMSHAGHHEFGARAVPTETSSDRSFGLVFTGFFTLLAAYDWWRAGSRWPI